MAFFFRGPFTTAPVLTQSALRPDEVCRAVQTPFAGHAIRTPSLPLNTTAAQNAAQRFGLDTFNWMMIDYVTWAGEVEDIWSYGVLRGQPVSVVGDYERNDIAQDFADICDAFADPFGIGPGFPPFTRGFWGD